MRFKPNISSIISASFVAILVVLFLLLFFWNQNNSVNEENVGFVVSENGELRLLTETSERVKITRSLLYKAAATGAMSVEDDPAAVLRLLHKEFDVMSDVVQRGNFDDDEKKLWAAIHPGLHTFDVSTARVVDLIHNGQRQQAMAEIENVIEPTQIKLRGALENLAQYQAAQINNDLEEAQKSTTRNTRLIWLLLGSLLVVAGFMRFAAYRTTKAEDQIRIQSANIRALLEISASAGLNLDQQIEATLKLGATVFNLPVAKVSRINAEENINEAIYLVAPEQATAGISFKRPLSDTFCSVVFANEKTLSLQHVGDTEMRHHPAYAKTGIETYIAAPIYVNNVKYGTVAFASKAPRSKPFSEADIDFITLIGKWVSASIERKLALDIASEKQQAVAANRAKSVFLAHMSHEIRTPLTAIIGFAETALDPGQSEQERAEAMTTITRSGRILLQIINDILDLSKIEAGKLEVERVPLSLFDVLGDVKAILEPRAREKGLKIRC